MTGEHYVKFLLYIMSINNYVSIHIFYWNAAHPLIYHRPRFLSHYNRELSRRQNPTAREVKMLTSGPFRKSLSQKDDKTCELLEEVLEAFCEKWGLN